MITRFRNSRTINSAGTRLLGFLLLLLAPAHLGRAQDATTQPPLITRGRIELNLAGAEIVLKAAQNKAAEMNLKVNIAVVDAGGHLLAFARMDGARPASGNTAMTKAVTAATFRQPSGPVPPGAETPDLLLNLSLQIAAMASGGRITTLYGGVPVVVDTQIIAGVGVGGASGEQDAEIARAGIEALTRSLNAP